MGRHGRTQEGNKTLKLTDKMLRLIGLGNSRRFPPPTLHAIADGLLITSTKAEAWFVLGTSNSDTQTEANSDAELSRVIATCRKAISGRWCQLKVVWSHIDGESYEADELDRMDSDEARARHVAARALRIDEMGLPERVLMLGVEIETDRGRPEISAARTSALDAIGADARGVRRKEIAYLLGLAQKIGRTLQQSDLRAHLAPAELIAWGISREMHRDAVAPRYGGLISGARLATLTRGRVEPWSDHLRFYDSTGTLNACSAVITLSAFPEEMVIPGDGEWLKTLAEITRINDEGEEIPVIADASVRFRQLDNAESRKKVNETRQSAKEQRKSAAKASTGDVAQDIMDTEELMEELDSELKSGGLSLVESHPRLVVTADNYEDLETRVDSVLAHYANIGITGEVSADEQRELWLETLMGDTVRVDDLGHVQDAAGFFGSWFWGGAAVGSKTGPAIGYLTGSTPGIVRNDTTSGAKRGDATTTFYGGRSGRGKTTAIMLSLLDAGADGAWVNMLDFKGDSAGVVTTAKRLGIPAGLVTIGGEHSGAADLFPALRASAEERESAPLAVARQVALLSPPHLSHIAETAALAAANKVAKTPNPSTWAVINVLAESDDTTKRELGNALLEIAKTGLGATVCGPPTGVTALSQEPGIWVTQMPGLKLPSAETTPDSWDTTQRISLACMRGFIAHSTAMSGSHALRTLAKVIAVPEVHRLLRVSDGRDFLDQIARMGRAFYTNLLLDSQDVSGVKSIEGLVEALSTIFIFQLTSPQQQDAAAELLGLPIGPDSRGLIRDIGMSGDPEKPIRHGHCIMRDYMEEVATVQWDAPDLETLEELSTNPDATATPRHDVEPDDLAAQNAADEEDTDEYTAEYATQGV